MENKEKRPAEMEAPTGTIQITLPDYNIFTREEQERAAKIIELFWMTLQANGLEQREKYGELPSMIIYFFGSSASLDICCRNSGERKSLYTDTETIGEKTEDVRAWLRGILEGMKHDRI